MESSFIVSVPFLKKGNFPTSDRPFSKRWAVPIGPHSSHQYPHDTGKQLIDSILTMTQKMDLKMIFNKPKRKGGTPEQEHILSAIYIMMMK